MRGGRRVLSFPAGPTAFFGGSVTLAGNMTADLDFVLADTELRSTMVAKIGDVTVTVIGTKSARGLIQDGDIEGFIDQAELDFVAKVADYGAALPAVKDTVTIDGVKYAILSIIVDELAAIVTFSLKRSVVARNATGGLL